MTLFSLFRCTGAASDDPNAAAPASAKPAAGRREGTPEENASFLSRVFFSYCNALVKLGFKRPLEHDDLWNVSEEDEAAAVSGRFQAALAATADPVKHPQVGGRGVDGADGGRKGGKGRTGLTSWMGGAGGGGILVAPRA